MNAPAADEAATTARRRFDPYRLSNPQVFLLSMIIFLVIVGFLAAILYRQVSGAFMTNPGLNGLILGVLAVGIVLVKHHVASERPITMVFGQSVVSGFLSCRSRCPPSWPG